MALGVSIVGAFASASPVALTGANQAVATSAKDYRGFTIGETAGATASVVIWDNASAASGTVLDVIDLAPGESAREWYDAGGLRAEKGIYVQVVSGSVSGSVRVGS